jgi:ribosomal protein S27AE
MWSSDVEREWQELTAGLAQGFRAWREAHPTADLGAVEAALDERWWAVRARLLEDAIQASPAADLRASPERPACPRCGTPMRAEGRQPRRLLTHGNRPLHLTRSYARCPACGTGLFPPGPGAGPAGE